VISDVRASVSAGTLTAFTIGDVLCPEAAEVLRHAGPELTVRGRVLYFSDSGAERDRFAIIEVEGIHTPLIVPVDRLRFEVASADQALTGAKPIAEEPATT
jgi:hypothetical protein